jgi:hypothetical protein
MLPSADRSYTAMLIRRVLPAIVATLAVYAGLAFAAGLYLREHYLTPLLTANNFNLPGSAWILSQWSTKDGRFAFAGGFPPINLLNQFCASVPPGKGEMVHAIAPSASLDVVLVPQDIPRAPRTSPPRSPW